jgi:hypothetical protein
MTTLIDPKATILGNAAAPEGLLQPQPDELLFGPVPFPANVQGVSLSLPVSVALAIEPAGDQIQIHARLLGDLSDLQRKIGPLIDTIPLPTDNCARFFAPSLVAGISEKELTIDRDVAILTLHGEVVSWLCLPNPFGSPGKTVLVTQDFAATLPFRVGVVDPHTIGVQLGEPSISLEGPLAGITQGILNIAGIDINAQALALLNRSLPPGLLQQTLPNDLQSLHPEITLAGLRSNAGNLALYVEMNAFMDGKAVGQLIRTLLGF